MASEVRVNQIQNRSGLSTVTFSDSGVSIAGVTTVGILSATGNSVFSGSVIVSGTISGTANPAVSLDLKSKTDAIALPQGTTAQRPTGNNPYIRYNTTNTALEFYNGTDWVEIISDYFPSGSTILG